MRWYEDAHSFARDLAERYGTSVNTAAAVIAALSPRNAWERNKVDAVTIFEGLRQGLLPQDLSCATFNKNKEKAYAIAASGNTALSPGYAEIFENRLPLA